MANVLVEESCLSGIASAIRTQNGLSTLYKPSEMMSGINDLRAREAWSGFFSSLTTSIVGSTTFTYNNPNIKSLRAGAFMSALTNITTVDLPQISKLLYCALVLRGTTTYCGFHFANNTYIENIYLSSFNQNAIYAYDFANCMRLSNLVLGSSSVEIRFIYDGAFFSCWALSEIPSNLNLTWQISASAFNGCKSLTKLILPNLSGTIYSDAFFGCSNISMVSLDKCTTIYTDAFANCSNITSIYLPKVSNLSSGAFLNVNISGNVELPSLSGSFWSAAIVNHSSATNTFTLSLPLATSVNLTDNRFCTKLYAQNATSIWLSRSSCAVSEVYCDNAIFCTCNSNINLIKAEFQNLISVSAWCFMGCTNLNSISIPKCEIIASGAFNSCNNLPTLSLPYGSVIYPSAFSYCSKLVSLYLMGSSVCKLSTTAYNTFFGCPIYDSTVNNNVYGSIYVPSSLYATYKASTNWVAISSRFVSM